MIVKFIKKTIYVLIGMLIIGLIASLFNGAKEE